VGDTRDHLTTQRMRTQRADGPQMRGACLVVIHGVHLGQRIDLTDVPVVIGRAPDSDVQIEHRSVSRRHCKVWHEAGAYFVRDLGATNHTYVNDRAVEQSELRDGDHIAIGETVLKFVKRDSLEARYHDALYELATVDSLTQLYNRRKFREFLEEAVARARSDASALALLFVDLDHFKQVNDRYGHMAGDEVLRAVAAALRREFRPEDVGGRLGGEEFAVLMPGVAMEEAMQRAESLRQTVFSVRCEVASTQQRVTASFGVAVWSPALDDASALMRQADEQLFRAKAGGRNRVCAPGA
jgi:diguanylate cyclase (GGDEF)-like protein